METNKMSAIEQAEHALRDGSNFELQCALERILTEYKGLIERCAKRVETYALSLELHRHIGLPDPVCAVDEAAARVRAISSQLWQKGNDD